MDRPLSFVSFRWLLLVLGISVSLLPLRAQSTVAEWQAKAVKEYPALAEPDSAFNQEFRQLYQEKKTAEPAFFNDPRWPWELATLVAGASGTAAAAPEAAETPAEAAASEAFTAQESGAAVAVEPVASPEVAGETPASPASPGPASGAADQSSEWEAKRLPESLGMEFARFRWWAPAGVPLRGVLVLAPGRGGDGRGMAGDKKWQTIARDLHFGIVACFLKNRADQPYAYQQDPDGATSELVNEAVEQLVADNGHSLKNPPLFFYGHSAGGNVSQNYANHHARRMVGAVIMRCPSGPGNYSPAKGNVPMLVYIGGKDKKEWLEYSVAKYEEGNQKRALWTLALHPEEGHGVGKTWALTEAFIRGVAELRLGKPGADSRATIRKLARTSGWLGDTESFEVGSGSGYKGKKQRATWLPDEATALLWQSYLKK